MHASVKSFLEFSLEGSCVRNYTCWASVSEGDALGFYLERVAMRGVLPGGAEGWKHLPQVSTDRAFCRKQIKILGIAVLFILPFLPNKMHIKSKNRKDLQLGFISS